MSQEQMVDLKDTNVAAALADVKWAQLKKQMNADNWSDELEDLVQSLGEKAAGNRELHDDSCSYWKRIGDQIYLPVIILSAVGGVSNFGAANAVNNTYWMYGIGVLNIFTAALASISQYYRPDEKSQQHFSVARNFGSFHRTITIELAMEKKDRMNSEDLLRWVKNEYDRIQSESPSIPESVISSFIKNHGRSKRNIPDVVSKDYEIKINGRDTEE